MSETSHPFTVVDTPDKGRVCIATQAFEAGDVLFEDTAFVHASEMRERCLACCQDHEASECDKLAANKPDAPLPCPAELLEELDEVADDMCDLDAVNTLDRARCFIQCMLMFRKDPGSLDPLRALTAANPPRCLEGVIAARERLPGLFTEGMSDKHAAHILGVLNTNSHELEQVEGSGLFLLACIMEHDCNPNCSFTTHGDKIWLTAIRTIGEGDRLSIDYGNNFYLPTAERRAELEDTYGFVCKCAACMVLPDLCRAFRCPSHDCRSGKVCPRGDGDDGAAERSPKNWQCLVCGHQCVGAEIRVLVAAEEALAESLESADELEIEGIDEIVAEARVIHPTHYAVFWAQDAVAKRLSGESGGNGAAARSAALAAERAWTRVVEVAEEGLPALHHEKVVYMDALAQARVVAGDAKGARKAYEGAHKMSVMVSGANTPPTLDIKALADRPPTSADELRARYNASK